MIIELRRTARLEDRLRLLALLEHPLRTTREIKFDDRSFVAVVGHRDDLNESRLLREEAVLSITPRDTTTFFCDRAFRTGTTPIEFGDVTIGNGDLVVIAGPCAVENEDDLLATAEAVARAGAHAFRAGAFKPRTSPYNFQGLGRRGLEMLSAVGRAAGLPTVSEVLDPSDIEFACEHVDLLQVGTRNMTNQALLKRLGHATRPVLLKRGSASRLEELVRAAEFIAVEGNPRVALCERGIQTFETATRHTLDMSAVPVLRTMTHLPVVVDPSHAVGKRELVSDMALAAAVIGADALLLEVHVAPERMVRPGDARQALLPDDLQLLMERLDLVVGAVGRRMAGRGRGEWTNASAAR